MAPNGDSSGSAKRRGALERAYRQVQRSWVQRWILPRVVSGERLRQGGVLRLQGRGERRRAWFHAASVGELESLIPVIEEWAKRGDELIVTVLSESARQQVERLGQRLSEHGARVLHAGYCPWEGNWLESLKSCQVSVFVTAKYEAWPELWLALGESGIPLVIVSCKARRSLRLAKGICRLVSARLPKMMLLPVREEDVPELKGLFPEAQIRAAGEPRWDRVHARARAGNARAAELVRIFEGCPRPWGVLGSVWLTDLEVWKACLPALGGAGLPGTIWIVPHRVEDEHLEAIEELLRQVHLQPVRTAGLTEAPEAQELRCLLVNEMGALSELYSAADWAFVGGGFGTGVRGTTLHSTIEPALYGIPVAGGPNGAGKFPEVAELSRTGQLRIVQDSAELQSWLDRVAGGKRGDLEGGKERWKSDVSRRLGAAARILAAIDEAMAEGPAS